MPLTPPGTSFVMRDNYDRTWTLAHNGTIFESEVLEPFVAAEDGDTDSERILCYIIDQVNAAQDEKGAALTKEERFALLNRIILEIAPENKLNLLIFDGEIMYVELTLIVRLRTGQASRHDLAVFLNEVAQGIDILVVDLFDVFNRETAELLALEERILLVGTAGLALTFCTKSHFSTPNFEFRDVDRQL